MRKIVHLTAVLSFLITVIFGIVFIKYESSAALTICITFGTMTYHFVMRLAVGQIFEICMKNRADYSKKWYQLRRWESRLYEKIKVKHWKNKMPTYDSSLFDPGMHTWDEIAQAMCQAELVHETIIILSALPVIASCWFGAFMVFLITSIAAMGADLIFVIIQRYNRPRIVRMAKRMKRRE